MTVIYVFARKENLEGGQGEVGERNDMLMRLMKCSGL